MTSNRFRKWIAVLALTAVCLPVKGWAQQFATIEIYKASVGDVCGTKSYVDADKGGGQSDREVAFKMFSQLVQLNSAINVLAGSTFSDGNSKPTFAKAVEHARNINSQLRALAVRYDQKTSMLIDVNNLKADLDKVDAEESKFVLAFNSELAVALAGEFQQFYNSYYSGVPWYARPTVLFVLSFAALALSFVTFLLLPNKTASASDIT